MFSVHRTVHVSHAQYFLARGSSAQAALFCVLSPKQSSRAHVMFRTLVDPAPFSSTLSTATSSSLLYPPNRTNPCALQSGLLFGPFAELSPLTGYEPNALVEVSSTEVTTVFLPSRKASIGLTYNSGEDIFSTPAVSEVDERSDLEILVSPLLTPERDKVQPHP